MNPDVYPNECDIIEGILRKYKDSCLDIAILLKPNPMDNDLGKFDYLLENYDNVFIAENLWLYDKYNNFNLMTIDAKEEWMDLLYYCSFSINVPSTVTAESLIMRKPVINIGYGAIKEDSESIMNFANAHYYIDLIKRNDVILIDESDEIVNISSRILNNEINVSEPLDGFLRMNPNVTNDVVKMLLKG